MVDRHGRRPERSGKWTAQPVRTPTPYNRIGKLSSLARTDIDTDTVRKLLFALPQVLSPARVKENWFLGPTEHGAILAEGCRDVDWYSGLAA